MHFKLKKKILSIATFSVVGLLAFLAILFIMGIATEPKIHLYIHQFDWEGKHGMVVLKFESKDGAFTTGEPIHVSTLLLYGVADKLNFFNLYFPNTMTPEIYNELISNKGWDITRNITETAFIIEARSPPLAHFENFTGVPPTSEFDIIWTQEGFQDGFLIIDEKPFTIVKESLHPQFGNFSSMEKVITIQPSDVGIQIKSNNYLIGFTLGITALTLLMGFMSLEMFWFSRNM